LRHDARYRETFAAFTQVLIHDGAEHAAAAFAFAARAFGFVLLPSLLAFFLAVVHTLLLLRGRSTVAAVTLVRKQPRTLVLIHSFHPTGIVLAGRCVEKIDELLLRGVESVCVGAQECISSADKLASAQAVGKLEDCAPLHPRAILKHGGGANVETPAHHLLGKWFTRLKQEQPPLMNLTPWVYEVVPRGDRGEELVDVLTWAFDDRRYEVSAALEGAPEFCNPREDDFLLGAPLPWLGYDYRGAFSPALLDIETRAVLCAALVVAVPVQGGRRRGGAGGGRGTGGVGCGDSGCGGGAGAAADAAEAAEAAEGEVVWEVVWFCTAEDSGGCGHATALFSRLREEADRAGNVTALLVESSDRAVPFWLTRPDCPVLRTVLRCPERRDLTRTMTEEERRKDATRRNLDPSEEETMSDRKHRLRLKALVAKRDARWEEDSSGVARGGGVGGAVVRGGQGLDCAREQPQQEKGERLFYVASHPPEEVNGLYNEEQGEDEEGDEFENDEDGEDVEDDEEDDKDGDVQTEGREKERARGRVGERRKGQAGGKRAAARVPAAVAEAQAAKMAAVAAAEAAAKAAAGRNSASNTIDGTIEVDPPLLGPLFLGKPYRYNVKSSTHILFPVAPRLVDALSRRGLIAEQSAADVDALLDRATHHVAVEEEMKAKAADQLGGREGKEVGGVDVMLQAARRAWRHHAGTDDEGAGQRLDVMLQAAKRVWLRADESLRGRARFPSFSLPST
jgi:hypothetical protein